MVQAYHTSASTLNLVRAFTQGGFADLRSVHQWNQGFMANPAYAQYEEMAAEIDRAVRFMNAAGVDFEAMRRTEFYSAHEALLLDYERALTRVDSRSGDPTPRAPTSCGSASAPARWTAPTSTSSPGSATRSA